MTQECSICWETYWNAARIILRFSKTMQLDSPPQIRMPLIPSTLLLSRRLMDVPCEVAPAPTAFPMSAVQPDTNMQREICRPRTSVFVLRERSCIEGLDAGDRLTGDVVDGAGSLIECIHAGHRASCGGLHGRRSFSQRVNTCHCPIENVIQRGGNRHTNADDSRPSCSNAGSLHARLYRDPRIVTHDVLRSF